MRNAPAHARKDSGSGEADARLISFELRYDTEWENGSQSYAVDSSYEEAYIITLRKAAVNF